MSGRTRLLLLVVAGCGSSNGSGRQLDDDAASSPNDGGTRDAATQDAVSGPDAAFGPYSAEFIIETVSAAGGEGELATRSTLYYLAPSISTDYAYVLRLEGMNDPAGQLDASVRLTIIAAFPTVIWEAQPPHVVTAAAEQVRGVLEGSLSSGELNLAMIPGGNFRMATDTEENGVSGVSTMTLRAFLVPNAAGDDVSFLGGATASATGRFTGSWPARAAATQVGNDIHGLCNDPSRTAADVLALGCPGGAAGLQPVRDDDDDGLEQLLDTCPELGGAGQTDTPGRIQCCFDGNGTLTLGLSCATGAGFVDGWQFLLDVRAARATVTYP